MFAGNRSAELLGHTHHIGDSFVSDSEHVDVVGVHRNIGMNVAVACMHMQCNEYAASQNLVVNFFNLFSDCLEAVAGENVVQRRDNFFFPRDAE